MTDREELIRALRLLFSAGDVFEIRVLKAVTAGYQRPHTESGYFDYEHIPQAATAVSKIRSFSGAYVTLNPVDPDLLARAFNHLGPAEQNATTADGDTVCRRWLPIDCDAVRKSNISSTDEEHTAALDLATQIRQGLASIGWPEPVVLDSGNGAQLLYRIDLPANDDGLVQRVIANIAGASTDKVHVDLTVFNPARIWRLPGTMNCKGDSIPARPHRMAHIIYAPEKLECVSSESLCRVLSNEPPTKSEHEKCSESGFSLDLWISRHLPELGDSVPYNGGRKWQFKVCPFNSDHTNGSAVLIEEPSGAVAFRCLHNSCSGNDWRKLREMLEPGCYDKPEPVEHPDVDLSGLLGTKPAQEEPPQEEEEQHDLFPDPGALPEELIHIPGFVDDYAQWITDTAPYPNRVLAFCASLAFLSFITGRTVQDERNTRTNLYLVALANPGTGKDHPRKSNSRLAVENMLDSCLADEFGSGEGLEDSLFIQPAMLYQVDEFDTMFNSIRLMKDARGESIIDRLLRFYGSSNGLYTMRKLALRREDRNDPNRVRQQGNGRNINNPHLVIFGTAVPKFFYQALSPRVLNNGLVARCLVLDAGKRGHGHKPKLIPVPDSVTEAINTIKQYGSGGNLDAINPQTMVVKATPEADVLLQNINDQCDATYDYYESIKETTAMTIWARAFEKVCKLSLLYAISRNPAQPIIDLECVEWSNKFVEFLTKQMLFLASTYSFENDFDEKCQKALRYMREAGGRYVHSALLKRMHESKELFEKIMDTLIESGRVNFGWMGDNRHKTKVYRLPGVDVS